MFLGQSLQSRRSAPARALHWVGFILVCWTWLCTTASQASVPPAIGARAFAFSQASPPRGDTTTAIEKVELEVLAHERGAKAHKLRVRGRYHIQAWQPGQPLVLLNFAEFFQEPLQEDRLGGMPHLQGPYLPGQLTILRVSMDDHPLAHQRIGPRRDVSISPGTRRAGVMEIEYTVKIPRRAWPFGCVRGICSLSGAIGPLPSRTLSDLSQRVVNPTIWEFRWPARAARPKSLFVEDSTTAKGVKLFYPHIAWTQRGTKRFRTSQFSHGGVTVKIWGARGDDVLAPQNDGLWKWRKKVRRELAASARAAIDIAQHFGLKIGWGDTLSIIVGPYFQDISMPDGQALLVSSTYMDVLPFKRFANFHRTQLLRSLLDTLAMNHLMRQGEKPDDLWVAGALGNALARRAATLHQSKKGDIEDAVHGLRFMPMVDQMLYGGQTSNAGAFFDSVEDTLPLRNHALYFSHDMPRGGRLAFKLRDALGQAKFDTWINTLIQDPQTNPRALAEKLAKPKLAPHFFDQWLGPYPEVDYAILDVQNTSSAQGWRCQVELARSSEVDLVESVDVQFTFPDKSTKTLVWKPRGKGEVRGSMALKSEAKVQKVTLDPHGKLAEVARFKARSWERGAYADPLFNNTAPASYRFLYTGIGFHLAVAEFFSAKTKAARIRSVDGYMSFAAGLRRDLRREFSFLIAKDRDTLLNLGAGMDLFFGRKVTPNRRRLKLSIESEVDFLTPSGLDKSNGVRATQMLSIKDDTTSFLFEPQRGHSYKLIVKRSDIWTPDPSKKGPKHAGFWRLGLDLSHRFRLAHGHVLALQAVGEMVFINTMPEFRGLARIGGLGRLSAFGADEIFARAVAVGLAEYRHTIFDHTRLNLLGLGWFRNVGGVLATGVGTASTCRSFAGFGEKDSWYGQVGYGITTLYDFLGMAPEMVRVDISVPIGRKAHRTCLGRKFPEALAEVQDLPPDRVKSLLPNFSFNILIEQPF